jgi:hypothetical protein
MLANYTDRGDLANSAPGTVGFAAFVRTDGDLSW